MTAYIINRKIWSTGRYMALSLYVLFALFPLFWLFRVSISPTKLLYTEGTSLWPSTVTIENYLIVLQDTSFPTYFLNSITVSLGTALCTTLVASAAGYAFSRFKFKGKAIIAFLLLLTQMFPLVMVIAPIYRLMQPLGLTDSLTGLIVVYTAFNTPFATFLMQSFFDAVPKDLEDAAMIDGCTRFQALVRIVLPLTLPGMMATLGFIFTAAWSELLFALMLINSESQVTFPVGLLNFISKFSVDWGQMMAAGFLALIPACIFFALIQKYLVTGMTAGAVKG
ncbi:carbohydrate ABC transporter permease [Kiloniella sp. EL199]|uniref:carbohydrate ABC transporter permease n=1 Tax=Kiloniella sp. EL199 TaxID=2107581 RepID=UPI000EA0F453|nr:carbohydrate ABC transporter permease [Kiloniella sp. EL199]